MRHEIVSRNPDIEVRFYLSIDEGSYVTPHWHDSLEMVFMLEGSITVTYEGKKNILYANDFNIVNSRVVHSVLSTSNKALVLQIPKDILKKYIPDIDFFNFYVEMHPQNPVEQTKLERVRKIFHDMYIIYDIQPEGYLLKFNSLLYDLLFILIHSYATKITDKSLDKDYKYLERLNKMIAYIKEHYIEKISVSELAKEFGYSEDYIARFFKKQTGMTIIEYLYAYRITKVYQDLIHTELTINDIFEKHGCNNYRVAMKVFKEIYDCTPKEKRKKLKEKGIIKKIIQE